MGDTYKRFVNTRSIQKEKFLRAAAGRLTGLMGIDIVHGTVYTASDSSNMKTKNYRIPAPTIPPPPPREIAEMWALRLTRQEQQMLTDCARVSKTTKTALIRWLIRQYYEQHVLGQANRRG